MFAFLRRMLFRAFVIFIARFRFRFLGIIFGCGLALFFGGLFVTTATLVFVLVLASMLSKLFGQINDFLLFIAVTVMALDFGLALGKL